MTDVEQTPAYVAAPDGTPIEQALARETSHEPMSTDTLPRAVDPRVVRRAASCARRGGRRRAEVRKRHTVAKVLLSTLGVLAMISGLTVAYGYRHLNENITVASVDAKIIAPRAKHVVPAGPDGPLNILVMGYDGRDCDGCAIDGEAGMGGSDTTILIHISGDRTRAYGISIPRDSIVDRPDCKDDDGGVHSGATHQMWNAAYAVAGEQCVISQVETTTGVPIDDYITVNFASFKNMVDAIGGVEVCVPETIDDPAHDVHLRAGTRKITGDEALTYVRARYDIGDGSDLGRTRRQQAFISAMISQVVTASTLANPVRVWKFLNAATQSLTTDFDGADAMAGIALQLKNIGLDKIQFITVPTVYGTGEDRGRVFWTDQADEIWQGLINDEPLGADLTADAINVQAVPNRTSTPATGSTGEPSGSTSTPPASLAPTDGASPSVGADGLTDEQRDAFEKVGLCT